MNGGLLHGLAEGRVAAGAAAAAVSLPAGGAACVQQSRSSIIIIMTSSREKRGAPVWGDFREATNKRKKNRSGVVHASGKSAPSLAYVITRRCRCRRHHPPTVSSRHLPARPWFPLRCDAASRRRA